MLSNSEEQLVNDEVDNEEIIEGSYKLYWLDVIVHFINWLEELDFDT